MNTREKLVGAESSATLGAVLMLSHGEE